MPPIIRVPPIYDISHWVEVPNFRALDPMAWLILTKATEGTAYLDPTYAIYSKEIRAAGIRLGAYHFMRPGDELSQADWFCEVVRDNGLNGDEVLALDLEVGGINLEQCKRFMDRVQQKTGIRPILYSTQLQIESLYPTPNTPPAWLENEWLWIAEYTEPASNNEIPPYIVPKGCSASRIALWQYSDKGVIGGTQNNVDLNIIGKEFIAHIGLNEPIPPEVDMDSYNKLTPNTNVNRTIRTGPTVTAGVATGSPLRPNTSAKASTDPADKMAYAADDPTAQAKAGDIWWRAYENNGAAVDGWIAEIHKGERLLNVEFVQGTEPPAELQIGLSITTNQPIVEVKVNGEMWTRP